MSSLNANDIISYNIQSTPLDGGVTSNYTQIDKDTQLTHHGVYIGRLSDIEEGVRCDCPVSNPSHSDGMGEDYAHTVRLGGGDIGVHCSGGECGCTYIPEVPKSVRDDSFEPIEEVVVSDNKAPAMWFDRSTEKYCIREKGKIGRYSKQGFSQLCVSTGRKPKDVLYGLPAMFMEFDPTKGEMIDYHTINTFMPSRLMDVSVPVGLEVNIPKTIRLLFSSMFNNEVEAQRFLNWLAFIYQEREKTKMVWVFKGVQGSGKGILSEVIMRGIFEHNMKCNLTDSNLESQFNSYMEGKMIVHFNEISAEDKRSRIAVKNRFKTLATDEFMEINEKGIKTYEVANHANFIINTNENIPVDIEENDRRFTVIETETILTDCEWFNGASTIQTIRNELESFAMYLKTYNVDRDLVSIPLETSAKRIIIDATKGNAQKIGEALTAGDSEFFLDVGLEEYAHNADGFYDVDEIVREIENFSVSNRNLSLLFECVFGSKITPRRISIMLKNHAKVTKFTRKILNKTVRGWDIKRGEGVIPF